jgi:LysR family nitrogen assimilation transcriptional regulator
MNLRMLENFLRVAAAGSVKGAAQAANLAQPALTRQIALLEQDFGAQLLIRHPRGVRLTEAGERVRASAERILGEVEAARHAVSEITHDPSGTVALGLPTSMIYVLSSALVGVYQKTYPAVMLKVHEAVGHVVADLLETRRIDVAILFWSERRAGIAMTPLVTEALCLAGPPGAGLDLNRPVPVTYLAEIPVILLAPQNEVRLTIENGLAQHGLGLRTSLEIEGQPLVLDLIKQGVGYTVLPLGAVQAEIAAGRVSAAPIRGLSITWAIGVNRMRAHVPAVRELIKLIHQITNERIESGAWDCVRAGAPSL